MTMAGEMDATSTICTTLICLLGCDEMMPLQFDRIANDDEDDAVLRVSLTFLTADD